MKQQITGSRDGQRWPAKGETLVVPDAEGAELCAAGLAEPVVEDRVEKRPAKRAEKRG
jgi:hypothetical protein